MTDKNESRLTILIAGGYELMVSALMQVFIKLAKYSIINRDRAGNDPNDAIDVSEITITLNWTLRHIFSQGRFNTVQWYLAHLK